MGGTGITLIATANADNGFGNDLFSDWIGSGLHIILHLFLVGSFVAFMVGLVKLVQDAPDAADRTMRYLALFLGALVVVGSQAYGASYADFIISSLSESRSAAFRFFGALLPAAAGVGLGYYLTRGMKRGSERVIRVLILVGTLCVTQFALMYAIAVDQSGSTEIGKEVAPNVAFVTGLGLVLMLNYGVSDQKERSVTSANVSKVREIFPFLGGKASTTRAPLISTDPAPSTARRDLPGVSSRD